MNNKSDNKNKTKVKKLALTLAAAQVFSILPALPISDIVGLNNGSQVYAAEPQVEYRWGKYSKKANYKQESRDVFQRSIVLEFYFSQSEPTIGERIEPNGDKIKEGEFGIVSSYRGERRTGQTSGGHYTVWITNVDVYSTRTETIFSHYSRGSKLGTVTSTNRKDYPDDGQSGDYWYIYEGVEKTKADNFTPQVKKNIKIRKGNKHNIVDDITNIPSSAGAKIKTNIYTDTVGTQTGIVTITFSDGSTKEVKVPVEVIYTQANKFEDDNTGKKTDPINVVKDSKPNFTPIIDDIKKKNPDIKDVTVPEDVDTKKPGPQDVEATVEFKDGSTTTITIPMNVIDTDAAKFKEQLSTIIANKGETLADDIYKGAITKLPEDLKEFKVITPLDTSKSGDSNAKVSLTFKDDSTKEITLKAKVLEVTKTKTVDWGKELKLTEGIKGLSDKDKVEDITSPAINTRESGNKTGKIKVTLESGETREFKIAVKVNKSESETNTTIGTQKITVPWGTNFDIKKGITNLPKTATVKDISDDPKVDTKKSGDYTVKAEITFADDSTKTVENIQVTVSKSGAENFTPQYKPVEVKKGDPIDYNKPNDFITNLPDGASVEITNKPSTDKPGTVNIEGKITFKDGSEKDIKIPVTVKEWDSVTYKDKVGIADEHVIYGDPIDITDNLTGEYPKGTTIEDITNPKVDTKVKGDHTGKAKITFPDGTTLDKDYKVIVADPMSDTFPKEANVTKEEQPWGKDLDPDKIITNIPEGSKDISITGIDTKKSGEQDGVVKITYPDGSKGEVPVKVTIAKSEAENFTPDIKEITVKRTRPADISEPFNNLPDGASVKVKTPVDTKEVGKKIGVVTVTFKDGSTKDFDIPVTVAALESDTFKPNVEDEVVTWGTEYDLTDNIKNKPADATVEDITSSKINTKKPGDYTGKVRITFSDKSTKEVEVPVKVQKSVADTFVPEILEEEIVKGTSIDLTDNVKNLPNGATVKDISNPAIDTNKTGKQTAKAEITFADGSKKEIEIPINVVVTAGTIIPVPGITKENIVPEVVGWGKTINLIDNIKNLPEGATVADITDPKINTKESGDYTGKVEVTFKDGSKRRVDISVKVQQSEAESFNPEDKGITTERTRPADISKPFNNLPDGANVEVKTPVDVETAGDKTGVVTVTFKDGSKKDFEVPVKVVPLESDEFDAQIETIVVDWGKPLDTKSGIKNLPEGANVEEITQPKVNTRVSGDTEAKARITFSDKSTQEVTISVVVNKSESENFKNKFNEETDIIPEEVIKGNPIDLTDNIKNLPDGAVVEDITNPAIDTNKVGDQTATAKITFNDGSTLEVNIPVKVVIKAGMITPVPTVGKSDIEDENVNWSGEIDLTDNIKNLPEGSTVKDITEPEIDTTKSGEYTGKVEITYPDGSKRIVEVPIIVDKSQAEKYEENPNIEPERIPRNGEIDLTDNVKDLPEGSTVVDTTKNPIDTSELGTSTGTVEVTFPDGTKSEFEVPVEVYKTESEAFGEPITTKEVVNKGGEIDLTDNVVNLPEDAKVVDTTDPKIDTNELGDYTATAKIVFKDGSETEIEIRVVVTDGEIDDTDNDGNDGNISGIITNDTNSSYNGPKDFSFSVKSDGDTPNYKTKSDENSQENKHKALDNLLNGISNLGRRNNVKSNENTTKYVFKIGEKSYKTINGNTVTSHKMDVAPYIKNDRTMMPLRYVAEAIGADVQWDNSTRTAYFEKDGLVAKIQIDGNKIVMSNGKVYEMDAKPDNINDRILVSITNVSRVFNLTNGHTKDGVNQNIEWNNDNRTVTIVK